MNTISFKLQDEEIETLCKKYHDCIIESPNEYIRYFIKTPDDTTISIYTTNKVLIQGANAHIYGAAFLHKDHDEAGSDEVGTGDYFGPVCVCACIVEKDQYSLIKEKHIEDSKKMDDETIMQVAPFLMSHIKHSLLIVDDLTYNRVHEKYNLNEIKAKLHNQAYLNLIAKGYKMPKACIIDQFEPSEVYFRHLKDEKEVYRDVIFKTKAESEHPSVACASVIARYAFLTSIKKMEKHYDMHFPLGSHEPADLAALTFCEKYGKDRLKEVCKLHFKNTERVLEVIKKA